MKKSIYIAVDKRESCGLKKSKNALHDSALIEFEVQPRRSAELANFLSITTNKQLAFECISLFPVPFGPGLICLSLLRFGVVAVFVVIIAAAHFAFANTGRFLPVPLGLSRGLDEGFDALDKRQYHEKRIGVHTHLDLWRVVFLVVGQVGNGKPLTRLDLVAGAWLELRIQRHTFIKKLPTLNSRCSELEYNFQSGVNYVTHQTTHSI